MKTIAPGLLLVALLAAPAAHGYEVKDFTPEGYTRQPSFVSSGGMLAKNEHAFIVHVDATVLPPALMAGYRYGIFYWWDIGVEVGGTNGVFQALLHFKMENLKNFRTESFFWANRIKTGYKYHVYDYTDALVFDDKSWIVLVDNSFGFRIGQKRQQVVYVNAMVYFDVDLHTPRRQTDLYVMPAIVGFETMIGKFGSFFVEAGVAISINGMETRVGVLYEGAVFPIMTLGVAMRTGERTAIYYVPDSQKPK